MPAEHAHCFFCGEELKPHENVTITGDPAEAAVTSLTPGPPESRARIAHEGCVDGGDNADLTDFC